jgi:hypothetical protein
MTTTTSTTAVRDDLFTLIHKGLRLGLFELTINVGRADWSDRAAVVGITNQWQPFLNLLRAHTQHEESHIFRLLAACDPIAVEPASEQHHDLDDLLDHLEEQFDRALAEPAAPAGLTLYRDLTRFVAAFLPHLYDEETRIMERIWACCSDEDIAATRAAIMTEMTPDVQGVSLRCTLPAIDPPTRRALVRGLDRAPSGGAAAVMALAEQVLSPAEAADLRAAACCPPVSAEASA